MGAQSHEQHHQCFTLASRRVTASVPAAVAVLADSFSWQPPRVLGKAAVLVLPQPLPFLMKDESSLLLKMKVLSPACYRQKCLFWQPPYAAIRQKRNLSEKDNRAQLLPVHYLYHRDHLLSTIVPLGEESFPWGTFKATAASSIFPYPYAYHACFPSEPLTNNYFSSSCSDWYTVWRSVQPKIFSWAQTLGRQQLHTRLLLAPTMALRWRVQI